MDKKRIIEIMVKLIVWGIKFLIIFAIIFIIIALLEFQKLGI